MDAEGRRKAEAPLTSRQAAAATAGIERAILENCVCVGEEERVRRGSWWCYMHGRKGKQARPSFCRAVAPSTMLMWMPRAEHSRDPVTQAMPKEWSRPIRSLVSTE